MQLRTIMEFRQDFDHVMEERRDEAEHITEKPQTAAEIDDLVR